MQEGGEGVVGQDMRGGWLVVWTFLCGMNRRRVMVIGGGVAASIDSIDSSLTARQDVMIVRGKMSRVLPEPRVGLVSKCRPGIIHHGVR